VPVARPEGPYKPGMLWAEPDVEHAAELLRRVYEDRDLAERIGAEARRYVSERHSAEAVASVYRERLSNLLRRTTAGAPAELPVWRNRR
jgi:glycosyltransferase involved in cell wall biosynthesis